MPMMTRVFSEKENILQRVSEFIKLSSSLKDTTSGVRGFALDVTCCPLHNFKSPSIAMLNEGEGNDSGQRDQATKGWSNQGRKG